MIWYGFLAARFGGATTWSATFGRVFIDQLALTSAMVTAFFFLSKKELNEFLKSLLEDESTPLSLFQTITRSAAMIMNFHFVPLEMRVLVTAVLQAQGTLLEAAMKSKIDSNSKKGSESKENDV